MTALEPAVAFTVKATVILGIAALLCLSRRRTASTRHAVWTAAFASILLLPVLSLGLPERFVPLPGVAYHQLALEELDRLDTTFAAARSGYVESEPVAPSDTTSRGLIGALYLVGLALVWLHLLSQVVVVSLVTKRSERTRDTGLLRVLRDARRTVGITRPVELRLCRRITTPVSVFLIRRVILVPLDFEAWPTRRQRAALHHELVHLARRDTHAHVVGRLALALCWWNPLAWWGSREQRRLRELACDERVLADGVDATEYASELLAASRLPERPIALATGMTGASEIASRVRAVLHATRPERAVVARAFAATLIAVTTVLSVVSSHVLPLWNEPVHRLRADLRDGGAAQRLRALLGVALRGERKAFQDVVPRLRSRDAVVRTAAVAALSRMGCEPGAICVAMLIDDPDPVVRAMVVARLGRVDTTQRDLPLDRWLDEQHPSSREAILRWLGEPDAASVAERSARALDDVDPRVRRAARPGPGSTTK